MSAMDELSNQTYKSPTRIKKSVASITQISGILHCQAIHGRCWSDGAREKGHYNAERPTSGYTFTRLQRQRLIRMEASESW